jgi:hypothetical protein
VLYPNEDVAGASNVDEETVSSSTLTPKTLRIDDKCTFDLLSADKQTRITYRIVDTPGWGDDMDFNRRSEEARGGHFKKSLCSKQFGKSSMEPCRKAFPSTNEFRRR